MRVRQDRVEALLSVAELAVIVEVCTAANIPFARWTRCLPVARPWLLLAVERRAAAVREERGGGRKAARASAAAWLGLSEDTVRSWRRRWRRAAYAREGEGAGCTLRPPGECGSVGRAS